MPARSGGASFPLSASHPQAPSHALAHRDRGAGKENGVCSQEASDCDTLWPSCSAKSFTLTAAAPGGSAGGGVSPRGPGRAASNAALLPAGLGHPEHSHTCPCPTWSSRASASARLVIGGNKSCLWTFSLHSPGSRLSHPSLPFRETCKHWGLSSWFAPRPCP